MTNNLCLKMYLSLLAFLISGCAQFNEGAVDMRKLPVAEYSAQQKPSTNAEAPTPNCCKDENKQPVIWFKNLSSENNARQLFKENDMLSLHLKSAFIKTFSEDQYVTPYVRKAFTRSWGKANGEIAIVANALQMSGGKELSQTNQNDGRVVFYSNDVQQEQFLNFNNMPIYGPLRYEGVPFGLRLSIFELDVSNEAMKSILQTLSELGSQAYPPASPALKVLNSIGSSLSGPGQDGNDVEFRYSMVLDPSKAGAADHFALEAGTYVLIRTEDRTHNIKWDDLFLNMDEGRLYKINNDQLGSCTNPCTSKCQGKMCEPYKDETYIVVEIAKNAGNVAVQLEQDNFSTLKKQLEAADKAVAERINGVKTAISTEVKNHVQKGSIEKQQLANYAEAQKRLSRIQERKDSTNQSDNIERWSDTTTLVTIIKGSIDNKGNYYIFDETAAAPQFPSLQQNHLDYFILELAKLSQCVPKSPTEYNENFSYAAFSKKDANAIVSHLNTACQ